MPDDAEDGAEKETPPTARERHGFQRTACACAFCTAPCKHMPGSLDVADLLALCPPTEEIFAWAEQHLRALTNKSFPTLVPARQSNGHCHWLFDGKCLVHQNAPYSCAFFDTHMTDAAIDERSKATIQARRDDATAKGLYFRVWRHLCEKGLIAPAGDRAALDAEWRRLRLG